MFWLARLGVAETLTEKIGHSMNSPSLIKTPSFKNKTSPLVSFRLSGKTFQSIYRTNKILAYWPLLVPSFERCQIVFRKLLRNCENLTVNLLWDRPRVIPFPRGVLEFCTMNLPRLEPRPNLADKLKTYQYTFYLFDIAALLKLNVLAYLNDKSTDWCYVQKLTKRFSQVATQLRKLSR